MNKLTFCPFINFTFHNVSINTVHARYEREEKTALHSTMFLLIPLLLLFRLPLQTAFTFHNVSINTCDRRTEHHAGSDNFTFHNVSINTIFRPCSFPFFSSLHSTMFLLIRGCFYFC